jgi:tetratricopeptide (TPR) repeat protein
MTRPARDCNASRLDSLALPGWMTQADALDFLQNDCVFPHPLTAAQAEDLWLKYKRRVEALPANDDRPADILPMSEADVKTARKFRARHPNEHSIVDIVRLNPLDLIIHQQWISPTLAERYAENAAPARWNQTALLDPPASPPPKPRRDGNTLVFDLPHAEFLLSEYSGTESQLRLTEPRAFVTVAFYAGRALLLTGYHRTFALARHLIAMPGAPRGVLFAVSNALDLMGADADEVKTAMMSARPARVSDFFDPHVCLPLEMKRRRFQMRVSYEVISSDAIEEDTGVASEAAGTSTPPLRVTRVHAAFESALRLQREGRLEEAIQSYAAILRIQPNNKEVHLNLSSALFDAGRFSEAKAHAQRAVSLDPANADAHCSLGAVLQVEGVMDAAQRHFLQALTIDPEHVGALFHQGQLHSIAGEFDDALFCFRKVLARQPDCADAWLNVSEIKKFSPSDPDLAALEQVASGRRLAGRSAAYAHFAFGKALQDCAEFDRSFEQFRIGNECHKRLLTPGEQSEGQLFRAVTAAFSRHTVERLAGTGNPTRVPVFVIGMPRSGTTLIEQILASHPRVFGAGELESLQALVRTRLDLKDSSAIDRLDTTKILQLAARYLQSMPVRADTERIVDKTPSNFLFAGLIHLLFPNAKIIHAVRDPVDTCVSCYTTVFARGQSFSYDLGELGRYWNRYRDLMNHWRSVLPAGCMLDVHYEELVSDFDAQVARMLDFCGLAWDEKCRTFHRTSRLVNTASVSQVRQPLYNSSVGRWRRFEKHLGPLLQELKIQSAAA